MHAQLRRLTVRAGGDVPDEVDDSLASLCADTATLPRLTDISLVHVGNEIHMGEVPEALCTGSALPSLPGLSLHGLFVGGGVQVRALGRLTRRLHHLTVESAVSVASAGAALSRRRRPSAALPAARGAGHEELRYLS